MEWIIIAAAFIGVATLINKAAKGMGWNYKPPKGSEEDLFGP